MRQHYYKPILRNIISQSLEMLECCPLKVLWSDRTLSIGKRKIKDIRTKFKKYCICHAFRASINWTIQKTGKFCNVSEHATPSNYYREGLDKETKKCVFEFHERDDISHMCPV